MAGGDFWQRLAQKGFDAQFLWELEYGYELSPRESRGILEAVKLIFSQDSGFEAGKVQLWVVSKDEGAGKPLSELRKISVWVTLDGGKEDVEVHRKYGAIGLRRFRILRVTEEVVDQGGVSTQEDLARLFQASVRTIRRDIAVLRSQGYEVLTRGMYRGIGPGVSHKMLIVRQHLEGLTYTEICRKTRHSSGAVKRYVRTFGRVVSLIRRGISQLKEIAFYVGISERLAREYVALYEQFQGDGVSADRIEELVAQVGVHAWSGELKKGVVMG
jgi:hypothetical protein